MNEGDNEDADTAAGRYQSHFLFTHHHFLCPPLTYPAHTHTHPHITYPKHCYRGHLWCVYVCVTRRGSGVGGNSTMWNSGDYFDGKGFISLVSLLVSQVVIQNVCWY